jgi:hypothetical protein
MLENFEAPKTRFDFEPYTWTQTPKEKPVQAESKGHDMSLKIVAQILGDESVDKNSSDAEDQSLPVIGRLKAGTGNEQEFLS